MTLLNKISVLKDVIQIVFWNPEGVFSLIWPIRGCAAGQRMVFVLSVLNRVYTISHKSVLNSVHDLCESVLIINRVFHARSDNKIEGVVLNRVLKLRELS